MRVGPSFQTGCLKQELQMVQLSATRCSCITILWVSLVSFSTINLCVASQYQLSLETFGYTLIMVKSTIVSSIKMGRNILHHMSLSMGPYESYNDNALSVSKSQWITSRYMPGKLTFWSPHVHYKPSSSHKTNPHIILRIFHISSMSLHDLCI